MKINSPKAMAVSYSRLKKFLLLLPAFLIPHILVSQPVPEPTSNKAIYTFLDEMANLQIIELYDVVKPYSRMTIYEKLKEIEEKTALEKSADEDSRQKDIIHLNKRQREELKFYLQAYCLEGDAVPQWPDKGNVFRKSKYFATAFNPPGVFYKDSVFTAAFQIIYGASVTINENGKLNHTYGGASLFGYLGKNSSRSYWTNNTCRIVYYQKYMAANMFTFYPF